MLPLASAEQCRVCVKEAKSGGLKAVLEVWDVVLNTRARRVKGPALVVDEVKEAATRRVSFTINQILLVPFSYNAQCNVTTVALALTLPICAFLECSTCVNI